MPDAVLIGGLSEDTEKDLMAVTVVNRGGQTTTLTNLVVLRFDSAWKRWRIRPSKSYVIPNPQVGGTGVLPSELDAGKKWTGIMLKRADVIPDIQDGTYYVGIYGTHRDRPHLIRIPKPRSKLPPNRWLPEVGNEGLGLGGEGVRRSNYPAASVEMEMASLQSSGRTGHERMRTDTASRSVSSVSSDVSVACR
jgi:hypothetical protein